MNHGDEDSPCNIAMRSVASEFLFSFFSCDCLGWKRKRVSVNLNPDHGSQHQHTVQHAPLCATASHLHGRVHRRRFLRSKIAAQKSGHTRTGATRRQAEDEVRHLMFPGPHHCRPMMELGRRRTTMWHWEHQEWLTRVEHVRNMAWSVRTSSNATSRKRGIGGTSGIDAHAPRPSTPTLRKLPTSAFAFFSTTPALRRCQTNSQTNSGSKLAAPSDRGLQQFRRCMHFRLARPKII